MRFVLENRLLKFIYLVSEYIYGNIRWYFVYLCYVLILVQGKCIVVKMCRCAGDIPSVDFSSYSVVALLQATDVSSTINSWLMSSSSPGDVLLQQLHLQPELPEQQHLPVNNPHGSSAPVVKQPAILCPVCCKPFDGRNKRQNLKHHLMTHTGERRYSCPFCGHRTAHKWHLKTHVLRRHPDNIMDSVVSWLGFNRTTPSENSTNITEVSVAVDQQPVIASQTDPSLPYIVDKHETFAQSL